MRILLVEDEAAIAMPLAKVLEKSNMPTDVVYDGLSGYMLGQKDIYDIILLDIMLPEMDGIEVLKKLRSENIHTPILLLTAKDSVDDKVRGLEYGADDYVSKPFSTVELIARIKALCRRNPEIVSTDAISLGDITLNVNTATAVINNETISLTAKETRILEILFKNPSAVISKQRMLDMVWGLDSEATENTVEIYMHYLRKKIISSRRVRIITLRGMGYTLRIGFTDD